MATSLAILLNQVPPPRAETYPVKLRRWKNPHGLPYERFDVTLPCGLLIYGGEVHGAGEARRVKAFGFQWATPEDKKRFSASVLAAIDASEQK